MQISFVNVAASWDASITYNIDVRFGSDFPTGATQTTLTLNAPNFRFYGYEVVTPTGMVEQSKQLPPTGGSLASLSVTFGGAPLVTSKWTIRIKAQTNGSFGSGNTITAKAECNNGDSRAVTKSVDFTKDGFTAPPPVPRNLKAVPAGSIAVKLTWSRVDQADTLVFERATNSGFSTDLQTWEVGGSESAYLDIVDNGDSPTLLPATTYFYRMKAVNPFVPDGTDWSDSDQALTTSNATAPDAPDGVKAERRSGAAGSREIKVSWSSIPKLTISTNEGKAVLTPTYQVKVGTAQGGPYTNYSGVTTETNLTVAGRLANTTYYFVVVSSYRESPASVSGNSDEASATTKPADGVPVVVTNFAAQEQSPTNPTHIVLTWDDTNDGDCNYKLWRGVSSPTEEIATVGPGTTTYTDTGLSGSTTYAYSIFGQNSIGNGPAATVSETTGVVPAAPGVPSGLTANPINDSQIALFWTASTGSPTLYDVKRGTAPGGPYTTIATIAASSSPRFEDINLTPNTTFYYVVAGRNVGGSSANSSQASATTRPRSVTVVTQSGFSFDPLARTMIRQIGGRAIYTSDRDRPVVWIAGCWYPEGLKRQLAAPTVNKTSGGALEPGTYKVYTKLLSKPRVTRSEFSPEQTVTITGDGNDRLRIIPTLTGVSPNIKVLCRDQGFDISGNQIDAADFVELYIRSDGSSEAALLDTIPLDDDIWETPGYWQAPADLNQAMLFSGQRRPMEILGECSLPPACSVIIPFGPRMVAFGETNIGPTADEIADGATLTISQGSRTFTVSDYTLTDGIIYHELWINGQRTGWYVYDVEGSTGYIRHSDPVRDEAGWEGDGGGFPQFKFNGTPSRMYTSAYYSGEAMGLPTFSPETYPPLCTFDRELFPDDNTDPVAAIVLNDALLIGKPTRWVIVRGGNEPDFPGYTFESLATGSGINSPRTLVKDAQDRAYYLGDTGPFRVTPAGVEKLNVMTGNQRLFEQVFDIASVPDACGVWFNREDWYVCAGLDLIGNSGRRDGFVMDLKTLTLMPFSLPVSITWMEEEKNSDGEFQIDFADTQGRTGVLFKKGLSVDGIDVGLPVPSPFATAISAYIKSAWLDTENRIGIRSFQPHMRVSGGPVRVSFSVIRKERMDDPHSEQIVEALQFETDDTRDRFLMANHSFPNAIVRLDVELPTNPANTRLELKDTMLEVIGRGPVQ